jgi:hypothetical protein
MGQHVVQQLSNTWAGVREKVCAVHSVQAQQTYGCNRCERSKPLRMRTVQHRERRRYHLLQRKMLNISTNALARTELRAKVATALLVGNGWQIALSNLEGRVCGRHRFG